MAMAPTNYSSMASAILMLVMVASSLVGPEHPSEPSLSTDLWSRHHDATQSNRSTWTFEQFAANASIPVELHWAHSADNQSPLALHRLPRSGAPAIALQHGLLDTSSTWVLNGRAESLGFMLYDAGFDVWVFNSRGNSASGEPPSWAFSWDEHAQYDLPASLKYVFDTIAPTNSKLAAVVAHSQGGTITLAGLSRGWWDGIFDETPRVALLAPATSLKHQRSDLFKLMAELHTDAALALLGNSRFSFDSPIFKKVLSAFCTHEPSGCHDIAASLFGPAVDCDPARVDIYSGHWPDRTSVLNMRQWISNARSGRMATRDGTVIDLTSIPEGTKLAVFGGVNDFLADSADLLDSVTKMGSKVVVSNLTLPYSHMGFTWADTAYQELYPVLVNFVI
eukprot:TRINITY_DN15449_c0_g1_i1.p1 TRINITY_DN15449_c0_g1~~TRINITY_DN15449_c0_g1_i1.p1  ORF type:complete len:393 (+),score=67.32 TRINITY_DN15449_c0_g1_i1:176-1354(+)